MERGGMFQVRIMLELRFFTSEILHLNGLVSSVTPMHKVWSRFYNRLFCQANKPLQFQLGRSTDLN